MAEIMQMPTEDIISRTRLLENECKVRSACVSRQGWQCESLRGMAGGAAAWRTGAAAEHGGAAGGAAGADRAGCRSCAASSSG